MIECANANYGKSQWKYLSLNLAVSVGVVAQLIVHWLLALNRRIIYGREQQSNNHMIRYEKIWEDMIWYYLKDTVLYDQRVPSGMTRRVWKACAHNRAAANELMTFQLRMRIAMLSDEDCAGMWWGLWSCLMNIVTKKGMKIEMGMSASTICSMTFKQSIMIVFPCDVDYI